MLWFPGCTWLPILYNLEHFFAFQMYNTVIQQLSTLLSALRGPFLTCPLETSPIRGYLYEGCFALEVWTCVGMSGKMIGWICWERTCRIPGTLARKFLKVEDCRNGGGH
ncbi:uncharacterized protein LOC132685549 isoform X2 [Panthera onca]